MASSLGEKDRDTGYQKASTTCKVLFFIEDGRGEFPSGPVLRAPCIHCRGHGFDPGRGSKMGGCGFFLLKKMGGEQTHQTAGLLALGGGNRVLETEVAIFVRHFYTSRNETLGKQGRKGAFPGKRASAVKAWGLEVEGCAGNPGRPGLAGEVGVGRRAGHQGDASRGGWEPGRPRQPRQ